MLSIIKNSIKHFYRASKGRFLLSQDKAEGEPKVKKGKTLLEDNNEEEEEEKEDDSLGEVQKFTFSNVIFSFKKL